MNQIGLSAIFLHNILNHKPTATITNTRIHRELRLKKIVDWKNSPETRQKSDAEFNREFYQKLAIKRAPKAETLSPKTETKDIKTIKNQKTSIIIAPHPDDEILGATNLISQKIASGEAVKIIYITDGDALESENHRNAWNYGKTRKRESIHATTELRLTRSDLYFLGFPDGYLDRLSVDKSITSSFTNTDKTSSHSYFPEVYFSKNNLIASLEKIINKHTPAEIYISSSSETHSDHSFIGKIFENNFNEIPAIFSYNIHRDCTHGICKKNQAVDQKKLSLIRLFQSQRVSPHHIEFLEQFAYQKEVFEQIK